MSRTPPMIPSGYLLTAQEHIFQGDAPRETHSDEDEWYIPRGILSEVAGYETETIRAARLGRYVRIHTDIVDLEPGTTLAVRLADIDLETGKTNEDPRVFLGVWNETQTKFTAQDEVTERFTRRAEELGIDLHLRTEAIHLETEREGGNPEGNLEGGY